jgi:hypothetical protein
MILCKDSSSRAGCSARAACSAHQCNFKSRYPTADLSSLSQHPALEGAIRNQRPSNTFILRSTKEE